MILLLKLLLLPHAVLNIYLNSCRKDFVKGNTHPILLGILPIIIMHPLILIALCCLGKFDLPNNPNFYWVFSLVCFSYLLFSYFSNRGLAQSNFALSNTILSTSVIFQSIAALVLLGEEFSKIQYVCFAIITIIIVNLNYPKKPLGFDRGAILVSIGVICYAFLAVSYRHSSTFTTSYESFLTGRTVVDLIIYSAFLVISPLVLKVPHQHYFAPLIGNPHGRIYLVLHAMIATLGTIFYYYLPASQIAILSTFALPFAFILGRKKYQELYNWKLILQSGLIFLSVLIFLLFPKIN